MSEYCLTAGHHIEILPTDIANIENSQNAKICSLLIRPSKVFFAKTAEQNC